MNQYLGRSLSQVSAAGLRVLLCNTFVANYSGSELYVRDVALTLYQRGHTPIIYSPRLGPLAEELRQAGLHVTDDLRTVKTPPDIIHGQHHMECMTALVQFPGVPGVYFCHGPTHWVATPPRHPRLLRYVVVSEYVQQWLEAQHGIPERQLSVILSFVNLERFRPRPPLPPLPQRALVFSNQARDDNYAGVVRETCTRLGIALDVVGLSNGNPCAQPETMLGNFDLVFARGRCALESLAVGAAVVCCDIEGTGPMVTRENQAWLRSRNLGKSILTRPHTVEALAEEIQRYDPDDARRVSEIVRADAGLEAAVDRILATYAGVLADWRLAAAPDPQAEPAALAAYLQWVSLTAPDRLANQLQTVSAQLVAMQAAYQSLHEETSRMQQTLTWRTYRRLVAFGPVRRLCGALARFFKAWRSGDKLKNRGVT